MTAAAATRAPQDLLTAADEITLARTVEAGVLAGHALSVGLSPGGASRVELALLEAEGEQALRRFVESNLSLVGMVVRQEASGRGLVEADVYQEGCLGLIEAVRRYDWQRGCRFATYGLFWIRAYVRASTAVRGGQLNVSVSRAERLRRARGLQAALSQELGREASPVDVGGALGRSAEWVERLLAHQLETSLDDEAAERQLADAAATGELDSVLDAAMPGEELLDHLDAEDRQVIRIRFGFGPDGKALSYAATARAVGLTVRQVRRIESRALDVLRGCCPQQARVHLLG